MRAAAVPGVAIERAEHSKRLTYPELVNSPITRLTILACEVGGRWSQECIKLVRALAIHRSQSCPSAIRVASRLGFERRWWALLSTGLQDIIAATLVDDSVLALDVHEEGLPEPTDIAFEFI